MQWRSLFGVETEYAVTGWSGDGGSYPKAAIAAAMLEAARDDLPSVRDMDGRGVFLGNGSRFLVDAGNHPELATPECLDPWELVTHLRAGERVISRLADAALERCPGLASVEVFRSNCDVGPPPTSWACHENYHCHQRSPWELRALVLPHLVSRVILTGAGGFRPNVDRLEYTLSPRAWFLTTSSSENTTDTRGIFNERDEPLSAIGFRLHVISGETLCSEIANILKVGTTALVVALADGGALDRRQMVLRSPVAALQRFAADPTCRARIDRPPIGSVSALEIQRHYLRAATDHLDTLPPWAGGVCAMWRSHLDQLETDPTTAWSLDWVAKRALMDRLVRAGGESAPAARELDARFGQLGTHGLAEQAIRNGALGGHQVSEATIEAATTLPPRRTRAWSRGAAIRELAADQNRRWEAEADWDLVNDPLGRGLVMLDDPFAGEGTEPAGECDQRLEVG